ncbi:hypothetical protein LP316_11410 [Thalassotalea sp. LPB0316]|uniref:outer membrane beta-barrel protein n=1 Tax=Thalassotalea sp. LPB0316 TaxID=2769490 RepID=UPI0018685484|nr:outer membrane beta-barrel protein [Thalassotalea sp. LPB0316]QOL24913.1 hypothetical protein LP316_11410 [Thalassotalea sp. LPB0316]
MKKLSVIASAMALAFSANVLAENNTPVSWDFAELGYKKVKFDGLTLDGYAVNISKLVTEQVYVFGSFARTQDDIDVGLASDINVELDQYNLGVGYRSQVNDTTDFFTAISYEIADVSAADEGMDDDGFAVDFGLRSMFGENLELAGTFGLLHLEGTDYVAGVSANYQFTENFSATLGFEYMADVKQYALSARYSF